MTEEVKKEMQIEQPSRREFDYYNKLLDGELALVSCKFEGKDRFAVARVRTVNGKQVVEPLAVVLNEADVIWLRTASGDLLPIEGSGRSVLN
jgi:hypothetical protein